MRSTKKLSKCYNLFVEIKNWRRRTGKAQNPVQKFMAGVAQLVRASVCGTECRQFESGHPPHPSLPMAKPRLADLTSCKTECRGFLVAVFYKNKIKRRAK